MGKNPFHEDLDDTFRGVRVRAHTDEHTYEGWCGRWYYNEHAVVIYNAERDDGEQVGAVTLSDPETVERLPPTDSIEEVRTADIAPSPYTYRSMDDAAHQKFIKETRERGHLLTYPTVRPVAGDEQRGDECAYEVVAGHRRFDTAQKAGLETIAARIADLDEWEAVERFVDDHVAIQGGDERHMYGQEEIDRMLACLREDWDDDRLREIEVLAPYLEEKLAATRSEALRQGYLADGRGDR